MKPTTEHDMTITEIKSRVRKAGYEVNSAISFQDGTIIIVQSVEKDVHGAPSCTATWRGQAKEFSMTCN